MKSLELWGGIECTVNRVNDRFHDQILRSGHAHRTGDLELVAALGIRCLRYPVLWERTIPGSPDAANWQWADERLRMLRDLAIEPIVGLLHHGSGPPHTHLLDEQFPELFADYARAVAQRYPWVERYTPINEPLTTARFCGLYGHWYPHGRCDRDFVRALLNQCRATIMAMQEIRRVNANAQLIQTDDFGCTTSTPKLAYQASFDNERRWLTWDLLCGKVNSQHPLWGYLRASGASEIELMFFQEHACPPDVIGINHYVTSDRYLSERREFFPSDSWGTNGRHWYADVETIRVQANETSGFTGALKAVCDRYALPVALTEVHLGCSSDEQLRWLWQAWDAARRLQLNGADIRAVTVWALFGSFDWNSLLTTDTGYYEPGAFDVRSGEPQRTELAELVTALATGTRCRSPELLQSPGWWQCPERVFASLRAPVPRSMAC